MPDNALNGELNKEGRIKEQKMKRERMAFSGRAMGELGEENSVESGLTGPANGHRSVRSDALTDFQRRYNF